jgi:hypothetical protein
VRESSEDEQQLLDFFGNMILRPTPKEWITFLNDDAKEPQDEDGTQSAADGSVDHAPEAAGGNAPPVERNPEIEQAGTGEGI